MKLKMLDLSKRRIMTLEAQKIELAMQILGLKDKSLLDKLTALVTQKQGKIVGYSVKGEALTEESLRKELFHAEKQIMRGEYLSVEAVKEEVSKW